MTRSLCCCPTVGGRCPVVGAGYGVEPVRLVSVANLDPTTDLEAGDTVDGVALAAGDLVLLPHQTNRTQNGVYQAVASGAASRAPGWASDAGFLRGRRVSALEGDYYGGGLFEVLSQRPSLGADSVDWRWLDRITQSVSNAFFHDGDFCTNQTTFALGSAGGGSAFQTFAQGSDGIHIGGVALQVTAANDVAIARWGFSVGLNWLTTHGPACLYDARVRIEDAPPDAVDDYAYRVGILDADIGASTDGWHHELRWTGAASRWVGITTVGGVQTVVDLCAPTGDWIALEARQNEGATRIDFFVDRVLLGFSTTNIPGTPLVSRPEFDLEKFAGNNLREVSANSMNFLKDYRPWK